MAGNKIAGLTVEINGEVTSLNKALGEVNAKSKDLQKELKDVEKLLKFDPENVDLIAQKQKILAESVANTRAKLDILKDTAAQAYDQLERGEISEEQFRALQRELIRTENELRNLESSADETTRRMDDLGESGGDAGDEVERLGDAAEDGSGKLEKMGGVLKGVGAALGTVAVAAGAAAVKLGTEVVNQFGELEQNLGGSEAVFGEYAESIQKIGEDAYKNLGVSQSEYLATANKMGALFQGSGIEQQKSLELTTQAMQRAADMASVMGIDMEVAMESVAGAAKGNFTMMDNLGVAMNATTIEAYAAGKGIDFVWNKASQAEKSEMAMQMFFENTEQYAGNFAKESTETISGSIGLLQAATGSFVAGLGNANADIENLAGNIVDAFNAMIENVVPVLENLVAAIQPAVAALAPAISSMLPLLLNTVTSLFSSVMTTLVGLLPGLMPVAVNAVITITDALIASLPLLVEAALALVVALAEGLSESLPELIPAAVDAVITVVETLIENVDMLVDAAIAIIIALAEGLIATLPMLIEKAPVIVGKLVSAVIENAPKLLAAAAELVGTIATGIVDNMRKIFDKGKEIIDQVKAGAMAAFSKLTQIGRDIVTGIWDGISEKASWLLGKIKKWCGDILDGIKGFFGIHSPSTVLRDEVGAELPAGEAQGIKKNAKLAVEAAKEMSEEVLAAATSWTDGAAVNPFSSIVSSAKNAAGSIRAAFAQRPELDYAAQITEKFDFSDLRTEMQQLPDKIAYAAATPKELGVSREDERDELLKMVSDAVGTALLAGLDAVGNMIFDALPKDIMIKMREREVASATWDAYDQEGRSRGRMYAPTREEIASIARSVMSVLDL